MDVIITSFHQRLAWLNFGKYQKQAKVISCMALLLLAKLALVPKSKHRLR
jgi:hypothetical protein